MSDSLSQRKKFLDRGERVVREKLGPRPEHISKVVGALLNTREVAAGSRFAPFKVLYPSMQDFAAELTDELIIRAMESEERLKVLRDTNNTILDDHSNLPGIFEYMSYCAGKLSVEDPQLLLRYHIRPYVLGENKEEVPAYVVMSALGFIEPHLVNGYNIAAQQTTAVNMLTGIDAVAVAMQGRRTQASC